MNHFPRTAKAIKPDRRLGGGSGCAVPGVVPCGQRLGRWPRDSFLGLDFALGATGAHGAPGLNGDFGSAESRCGVGEVVLLLGFVTCSTSAGSGVMVLGMLRIGRVMVLGMLEEIGRVSGGALGGLSW